MRRIPPALYDTDDGATPPAGVSPDPAVAPAAPAPVASPPPADTPEPPARTYTAAEMREVRSEAQNLRARLREAETGGTATATALEAARAEAETLRGQVASLTDRLRGYVLREAIAAEAREGDADDLRGVDPDLAARLIDGVEYDDAGAPRGLGPALRKLVKRYPQIAAAPTRAPAQPPAGGGQARRVLTDDTALIAEKRRQIGAI